MFPNFKVQPNSCYTHPPEENTEPQNQESTPLIKYLEGNKSTSTLSSIFTCPNSTTYVLPRHSPDSKLNVVSPHFEHSLLWKYWHTTPGELFTPWSGICFFSCDIYHTLFCNPVIYLHALSPLLDYKPFECKDRICFILFEITQMEAQCKLWDTFTGLSFNSCKIFVSISA